MVMGRGGMLVSVVVTGQGDEGSAGGGLCGAGGRVYWPLGGVGVGGGGVGGDAVAMLFVIRLC